MSLPNFFCALFSMSSEFHQTIPAPHHTQGHLLSQPVPEGAWPPGTTWLSRCPTTLWDELCLGPGKRFGNKLFLAGLQSILLFIVMFSSFRWGPSCPERGQHVCGGSRSSSARGCGLCGQRAQLWESRQLLWQPRYWNTSLTNLLSDDVFSLLSKGKGSKKALSCSFFGRRHLDWVLRLSLATKTTKVFLS